jgi:hypothetical protein
MSVNISNWLVLILAKPSRDSIEERAVGSATASMLLFGYVFDLASEKETAEPSKNNDRGT